MAISVKVPKEITEYEEKIILGLSVRKIIALTIACALGIATYFLCWHFFNMTIYVSSNIIFVEAIPIVAIGFIPKKNGIGFERQLYYMLRQRFGKNKLPYEAKTILENKGDTERKSKYAWIFERERACGNEDGAKQCESRKFRILHRDKNYGETPKERDESKRKTRFNWLPGNGTCEKADCEYKFFKITKKGRERKRKAALREIKAAREESKAAKHCCKKKT